MSSSLLVQPDAFLILEMHCISSLFHVVIQFWDLVFQTLGQIYLGISFCSYCFVAFLCSKYFHCTLFFKYFTPIWALKCFPNFPIQFCSILLMQWTLCRCILKDAAKLQNIFIPRTLNGFYLEKCLVSWNGFFFNDPNLLHNLLHWNNQELHFTIWVKAVSFILHDLLTLVIS